VACVAAQPAIINGIATIAPISIFFKLLDMITP
jgi:hypothetical protein